MSFAIVVGTAGCSAANGEPAASPSPTPMFDSDEEAEAAAVEVYERYLAVNAAINADHGTNAERILDVTTNRYGTELLADFREMREAGVHITGAAVLLSSHVVEIAPDRTVLVLGMCVDVGPTRIINEYGDDVTPEGKDLAALEVSFKVIKNSEVRLNGSEEWLGDTSC